MSRKSMNVKQEKMIVSKPIVLLNRKNQVKYFINISSPLLTLAISMATAKTQELNTHSSLNC